jgi:hypothetical protein
LEGGEKGKKRKQEKAAASVRQPSRWRKVLGAFQLNMPVHADHKTLLENEERTFAVMQWIAQAIPQQNRWSPVFERYLKELGGRVQAFGGDPGKILPSPTGGGVKHGDGGEEGETFTGKISGLIFDHFGDFAGFTLVTQHGPHKFHSREPEMEELAERVWRERLRITVHADKKEKHRVLSVVVLGPPAAFEI